MKKKLAYESFLRLVQMFPNCQPCLDYHVAHARKTGAEDGEILAAIEVGKQVRRGASAKMDEKVGLLSSGPVEGRAEAGCGCH